MKNPIEYYITQLLYLHDCVIVPGFGGFVGNNKSSYIHPISGIIHPPSKVLLFNKNLTHNDGLLASYIAQAENLNIESANTILKDFVKNIESDLSQKGTIKLDKIGIFSKGKEGNITFSQNNNYNYNVEAFGMQVNPVAKKIVRSITTEKEGIIIPIQKTNWGKTLAKAAAVLIPLIGISLISITQEQAIQGVYTQMASMNPFSITKDVVIPTTPTTIILKESKSSTIELENPISSDIITQPKQKNYFLIAGVFEQQQNANNLLEKLRSENHDACLLPFGRFTKVAYSGYETQEDAILALHEIWKTNKDAWLLTK